MPSVHVKWAALSVIVCSSSSFSFSGAERFPYKLGEAWATCYLSGGSEYCNDVLCDNMVMTFSGGMYFSLVSAHLAAYVWNVCLAPGAHEPAAQVYMLIDIPYSLYSLCRLVCNTPCSISLLAVFLGLMKGVDREGSCGSPAQILGQGRWRLLVSLSVNLSPRHCAPAGHRCR